MLETVANIAPIFASLFCQLLLSLSAYADSSGLGAILSFLAGKAVLSAARMAVAAVILLALSSTALIAADSRNGSSGFVRQFLTMEQTMFEVNELFPGNTPYDYRIKNKLIVIRFIAQQNGGFDYLNLVPSGNTLANSVYGYAHENLNRLTVYPLSGKFITKSQRKEIADYLVGIGSLPADNIFNLVSDNLNVMLSFKYAIWHTGKELVTYLGNLWPHLHLLKSMPSSFDRKSFIQVIDSMEKNLCSVDLIPLSDGISYIKSEDINNHMLSGLSRLMRFNISQNLLANTVNFAICTRMEEGEEISRVSLMRDIKTQIIRLFEIDKGELDNFMEDQSDQNNLPPEISVALISFERIADELIRAAERVPGAVNPHHILLLISFRTAVFGGRSAKGMTDITFPGSIYIMFPEIDKLSNLCKIVLHEMGHMYQGLLIILSLMGSDMANSILINILTLFGFSFVPGDMSEWMPIKTDVEKLPAELLPLNFEFALVMALSGPGRMLDLYPWNMLKFDSEELGEWQDRSAEDANVGKREVLDFVIWLLTGRSLNGNI
ncbi:MAG: hypothetical protein LBT40_15745 [Deltaproteobacteria bacterium]|jgi:hypothetical protein|nr:hypothetical protein [Deltaproteobacteria bacterium]